MDAHRSRALFSEKDPRLGFANEAVAEVLVQSAQAGEAAQGGRRGAGPRAPAGPVPPLGGCCGRQGGRGGWLRSPLGAGSLLRGRPWCGCHCASSALGRRGRPSRPPALAALLAPLFLTGATWKPRASKWRRWRAGGISRAREPGRVACRQEDGLALPLGRAVAGRPWRPRRRRAAGSSPPPAFSPQRRDWGSHPALKAPPGLRVDPEAAGGQGDRLGVKERGLKKDAAGGLRHTRLPARP